MTEPGGRIGAPAGRRRRALSTYAIGVAILFLGLLSQDRLWHRGISGAGLALLLVGLARLLSTLRAERLGWPHPLVGLLTLCAAALNGYEQLYVIPGRLSVGWLLWSLLPYALALALSAIAGTRTVAIGGAGAALLFDLVLHRAIAAEPPDIGAAFIVMLRPLVSTLAIVPAAVYGAWRLRRLWPSPSLTRGSTRP